MFLAISSNPVESRYNVTNDYLARKKLETEDSGKVLIDEKTIKNGGVPNAIYTA